MRNLRADIVLSLGLSLLNHRSRYQNMQHFRKKTLRDSCTYSEEAHESRTFRKQLLSR